MKLFSALLFSVGLMLMAGSASGVEESKQRDEAELRKEMEAAREELAEAAKRVAELSRELGDGFAWHFRTDAPHGGRRAMLGINIGESDGEGVEVLSVTPGGPADKAGLQAGDRITAINKTDLKKAEQPSRALIDAMADVEPGSEVSVEYLRGKDKRKAQVKAEEMTRQFAFMRHLSAPDAPRPPHVPMPGFLRMMHGWGDIELVQLSPQLGEYFGTDKGLLVVSAPDEKSLKVQDGDVILKIGGREPQDPRHAMRILGSYRAGEKVEIDLIRKRKKMTVEIEIPERRSSMRSVRDVRRDIIVERASAPAA